MGWEKAVVGVWRFVERGQKYGQVWAVNSSYPWRAEFAGSAEAMQRRHRRYQASWIAALPGAWGNSDVRLSTDTEADFTSLGAAQRWVQRCLKA